MARALATAKVIPPLDDGEGYASDGTITYDRFMYLWPPRPENAIAQTLLGYYERKNWLAQVKMNGTCNVIAVSPNKEIIAMTRHNESHKLWSPNEDTYRDFASLPGKGWYVFTAELMHSKGNGLRNINYVHDILVNDGRYLTGSTMLDRQRMLTKIFDDGTRKVETISHRVITPSLWLAKNHILFTSLFEQLSNPEHEGIVMKNPNAKLELCARASANSSWSVKSRKLHKNFSC